MRNRKMQFVAVLGLLAATLATLAAQAGRLPEFMDAPQLAAWRAQHAAPTAMVAPTADEQTSFFTGKPYDATSGTYLFKYRSYDPTLARWTSSDPSGFPDGANNFFYAPVPTRDFDFQGLLKWSTLADSQQISHELLTFDLWIGGYDSGPVTYDVAFLVYTVKTDNEQFTINLWKYLSGEPPGSDYSFNCHGYTFANGQYWINGQVNEILQGDGYKLISGNNYTGARVAYWGNDVHSAVVNSVDAKGRVISVTGKIGAQGLKVTAPADQNGGAYGQSIQYYE